MPAAAILLHRTLKGGETERWRHGEGGFRDRGPHFPALSGYPIGQHSKLAMSHQYHGRESIYPTTGENNRTEQRDW